MLNASANTGYPACNPIPMPSHWEPWPGKTNTVLPAAVAVPRTTEPPTWSPASSSSPANNRSRSPPTTTARCSKTERPANDHPTSATSRPSSPRTYAANRAACPRNADSDFADTTHGTTGPAQPASRRGTTGTASIITCALVPLIPNDDTPARRVRAPAGHTRGAVNNSTAPADQSTCGLGTSTCNVAGNSSWRIANTILITPATPAAACV
ncbi:Uncharacterised protein [Mycobacterium tuberculosis]|nr:Uncharacterised protein [Mycobacterium tuberculosis]